MKMKNEVLAVLFLLLCSISVSAACGLKDFVFSGNYKNYNVTGVEECYNTTINVTSGSEIRVVSGGSLYTENVVINSSGLSSSGYISGVFIRGGNFTAVNTTFKGHGTAIYTTFNVTDGGVVNFTDVVYYNPGHYFLVGYDGVLCSDSEFYMSNVSFVANTASAGMNLTGCNVVMDDVVFNGSFYGITAPGTNITINNSVFSSMGRKPLMVSDSGNLYIYNSNFSSVDNYYKYGVYAKNVTAVILDGVIIGGFRNGSVAIVTSSTVNFSDVVLDSSYLGYGAKLYNITTGWFSDVFIYNHSGGGFNLDVADYLNIDNMYVNGSSGSIYVSNVKDGNITNVHVLNGTSGAIVVFKSQINYISNFNITNITGSGLSIFHSNITGKVSNGNITTISGTGMRIDNSNIDDHTVLDVAIVLASIGIEVYGRSTFYADTIAIVSPTLAAFLTDGVATVSGIIDSWLFVPGDDPIDLGDVVEYISISSIGTNTKAAYNPHGVGGSAFSVGSQQQYHQNIDLPNSSDFNLIITSLGNGPNGENMSLYSNDYKEWMGGTQIGYYHWRAPFAIVGSDIYYAVKNKDAKWDLIKHNIISDEWVSVDLSSITRLASVTGVYNFNNKVVVFGEGSSSNQNIDGLYQVHSFTPITMSYDGCLTCGTTGNYLMKVYYTKHSEYDVDDNDDPCGGEYYCLEKRDFSYTKEWTFTPWFNGYDYVGSGAILDRIVFDADGGFWLGGYYSWGVSYHNYGRDAVWFYFYDDGSGMDIVRHIVAPMRTTYSPRLYYNEYPILYDDFMASGDHISAYQAIYEYNSRVHLTSYSGDDSAGDLGYGWPYPKAGYLGDDVVMGAGLYEVSIDGDYLDGADCYIRSSNTVTGYSYACTDYYTVNRYVNSGNSISKTGSANFTNGSGIPVGRFYDFILSGDDKFITNAIEPTTKLYAFDAFGGSSIWDYYKTGIYYIVLGGDSNADWDAVIAFNGNYTGDMFTIISDDFPVCQNNDWACGSSDSRGGLCDEYGVGIPGVLTGEACRIKKDYGAICTLDPDCKSRNCDGGLCGGPTHYCDMNPSTSIDKVCVPAKASGVACTRDAQCLSGKCINGTYLDYSGKGTGDAPNEFWGLAFDNATDSPDLGYQELGICAPVGYECHSTLSYNEPRYHNGTTQDTQTYTYAGYEEVICGFDEDVVSDADWANNLDTLPINNVNFTARQKWCNVGVTGFGTCDSYYDSGLDYSISGCSELGVANFQFNIPNENYYKFGIYASHTGSDYEFVDEWDAESYCDDLTCSGSLDLNDVTGDYDQTVYIKVVALNYDIGDFCAAKACTSNTVVGDYVSENITIAYAVSCWDGPTTTTTTTTTTTLPGQTTTTTLPVAEPQDNVCGQYCAEAGYNDGRCSDTICVDGEDGCHDEFQNLCSGCANGDYCHCFGGDPIDPGFIDIESPICDRVYDDGSVVECSFKGNSAATQVMYGFVVQDFSDYATSALLSKTFTDSYYNVKFCIDFVTLDLKEPDCKGDSDYVQITTNYPYSGFEQIALVVAYYDASSNIITKYPAVLGDLNYMYYDGCLADTDCSDTDCDLDSNSCSGELNYRDGYPRFVIDNNVPKIEHRWHVPSVCKVWNADNTACVTSFLDNEFSFILVYSDEFDGGGFVKGGSTGGVVGIYTAEQILSDYTWADIVDTDFKYSLMAYYVLDGQSKHLSVNPDPVNIDSCDDGVVRLDCSDGKVCSAVDGTCGYGASGSCSAVACTSDAGCTCIESTTYGSEEVETYCFEGFCRPQGKTCVDNTECSSVYPYASYAYWEGSGSPEFFCQLRADINFNIWAHYTNPAINRDNFYIPTYAYCWYERPNSEVCIDDYECISGKCSNNGAYTCDGVGSGSSDNTCTAGILSCVHTELFGNRDDDICYYDGVAVASCMDDDLCYAQGVCVDSATVLCDANNPDGSDGDLLCQGPSGLNDADAYCDYDGVCKSDDVDPGEQCRTDEWCGTGYTCEMGVCTAVGSCPWSACKSDYIDLSTNDLLYKGRGVLNDGDNCGCGAIDICVPISDDDDETDGVCVTPLLNGGNCGTGNTLVSWDHGDYLCASLSCIGDSFGDYGGGYSGTCRPATTQCRRNVDVSDDSITWDPEEYCHCRETPWDFDGDSSPCSSIVSYSYSQTTDNILSTTKWCYVDGAPRPAGGPVNEDYRCYDRLYEGMLCSVGYQCLSGVCSAGGVCAKGLDEEGSAGDSCYLNHVTGNDLAVWNRFSNGETSTNINWVDTCGVNLYCDVCSANGYLVEQPSIRCDDLNVKIYNQQAGICRAAKTPDQWCYSASQCLGYDSGFSDVSVTTYRCVDGDGSGECSDGNPFCRDSDTSTYNRFCEVVAGETCIADEREPYNEFTVQADDSCYDNYLMYGSNSFCDDRNYCYIEGDSGDIDFCEDLGVTYEETSNLVHANENSKCVLDYCAESTNGESYLSADCMRDPEFDEFHVNYPRYIQEQSVVYCDGDGGKDYDDDEGGLCKWRKPVGKYCDYSVECLYGLECSVGHKCVTRVCNADSDCVDGYRCVSNKCEYLSDGGFIVTAVNGFTKPRGSPFVLDYDFVVSCDNEDYGFRIDSDTPISVKYSVENNDNWAWFGSTNDVKLTDIAGLVPDLCDDVLRVGGKRYKLKSLRFASVVNGVVLQSTISEKNVLVLHQGLSIESQRCYGSDLNEQCGITEDRNRFVLVSDNTYKPSGTVTDDPRRFMCDSASSASSDYDNPMYPRVVLTQFGDYRYALIENWSTQKYYKCVDEFGYVHVGSALVNPAELLFELEFTWEQQIIIMLVFLLGVPTLVLAGTKKRN